MFCRIYTVDINHTNHSVEKAENVDVVVNRVEELLSRKELKQELCNMIENCGRENGFQLKSWITLTELFPRYSISYNAVRNSIYILGINGQDADQLVSHMTELRKSGVLEYFSYVISTSNVLEFITWSFKGSKEVVKRCSDICFWDYTHHMTRYSYKLSSFTIVDSEK